MRITGVLRDPDHWLNYFKVGLFIRLDGERIDHVVEADDAAGYVIVNVLDEKGKPMVDVRTGALVRARREGKVEFVGERVHVSKDLDLRPMNKREN